MYFNEGDYGKIKRRGENYTIPQIDLSVEPKNTKEEFKYLYENVTVEKRAVISGTPIPCF